MAELYSEMNGRGPLSLLSSFFTAGYEEIIIYTFGFAFTNRQSASDFCFVTISFRPITCSTVLMG